MKTSKLFILVSLLACIKIASWACGPFYYSAADNLIYRIVPPFREAPTTVSDNFAKENVKLWSKQTGCSDIDAIHKAIYDGSLANWEAFYLQEDYDINTLGRFGSNDFVKHLAKNKDDSAIKVLYLSKLYENIRNAQRSPWYYNSRIDTDEKKDLQKLFDFLQKHMPFGDKYADRYYFLAIKCLWALGEYNYAIALWDGAKKNLRNSIFYEEAEDYVARSYNRLGCFDEAGAIYRRHENYAELIPENAKLSEKLRIMLDVSPNTPQIRPLLQEYLSELDRDQADTYYGGKIDTKTIFEVCKEALNNPKVQNKAMWRYALACVLEYKDKYADALAMLKGAENGDGDEILRKSVRILTFHLRSRVDNINKDFERYAINEVKWLDKELQQEWLRLPQDYKDEISRTESWCYDMGNLNVLNAYSALRRIVLEDSIGLAWRMADAGYGVRALQIANVADNRLFMISDNQWIDSIRTCDKLAPRDWNEGSFYPHYNYHDYSNGLFVLADRMDAHSIEEYIQRQTHPKDENDRWFNDRGYTNSDYWQDIIGTHYLREQDYQTAVEHFKLVSPKYQRQMNIQCSIDPFSIDRSKKSQDSTLYKLHFAQKMDSLQRYMLQEQNADKKGLAMLEFSIGLENSFDMCWWLTSYQKGWSGANINDIDETIYGRDARDIAKKLRKEALETLSTDNARAKYHLRMGHYSITKKLYAHTPTGKLLAIVCDERWHYRNP